MNTVFGPILSRRFGKSLGIDLSPGKKQCNYDCLYCELSPARPVTAIENPVPAERIIGELHEALQKHHDIDVVTLTANGEPTLYPHLATLVEKIREMQGTWQTLILSNASTIVDARTREILTGLDIVKLSLDCATPLCFKRLDRPAEGIELDAIIDGIRTFRRQYEKTLILEILLVEGINTGEEEIAAFNAFLPTLGADRIDIGTVDRPPAYPVEPLDTETLHAIAARFDPALPLSLPKRRTNGIEAEAYSIEEILETLRKRPLTHDETERLFDEASRLRLKKLLYEGRVVEEKIENRLFYTTPSPRRERGKRSKNQ